MKSGRAMQNKTNFTIKIATRDDPSRVHQQENTVITNLRVLSNKSLKYMKQQQQKPKAKQKTKRHEARQNIKEKQEIQI